MAQAFDKAAPVAGGEAGHQGSCLGIHQPVVLQPDGSLPERQPGDPQGLVLRQALGQLAVERHEEGGAHRVVHEPEGAQGAAAAGAEGQAHQPQFALLIAQGGAAGAQAQEIKPAPARALPQAAGQVGEVELAGGCVEARHGWPPPPRNRAWVARCTRR